MLYAVPGKVAMSTGTVPVFLYVFTISCTWYVLKKKTFKHSIDVTHGYCIRMV